MVMEWLDQHFREIDNFPRPDWEAINAHLEANHKDADLHSIWCGIARSWVKRLSSGLPANYDVHESENFILVTSESEKYVSIFQGFLERTRKRILKTLHGIASDEGFGKHVVLIFADMDLYYAYISYFYEKEGAYGLSSGIYLNKGYEPMALT